jgi:hypothetical protein
MCAKNRYEMGITCCCRNCDMWKPMAHGAGQCRALAPQQTARHGLSARWPVTHDHDWCGEHVKGKRFLEELESKKASNDSGAECER